MKRGTKLKLLVWETEGRSSQPKVVEVFTNGMDVDRIIDKVLS